MSHVNPSFAQNFRAEILNSESVEELTNHMEVFENNSDTFTLSENNQLKTALRIQIDKVAVVHDYKVSVELKKRL